MYCCATVASQLCFVQRRRLEYRLCPILSSRLFLHLHPCLKYKISVMCFGRIRFGWTWQRQTFFLKSERARDLCCNIIRRDPWNLGDIANF
mmetsp:Transcript_166039/g.532971  ORF Transcript_166039/g.532971 Transcript_166039/m.532971 type:complete len:91 (+) Transcript_166039:141-413(+)